MKIKLRTWHFERLAHAVWLTAPMVWQHHALFRRALLGDDPGEPLWQVAGLLCFELALLALGGVASTGERQRERSQALLEANQVWDLPPKAVAGRYLKWAKVLMALSNLHAHAWMSVASVAWDVFVYPAWRRIWRRVHPLVTWDFSEHA